MAEIIMPKMGDAMTEGKVVRWYKQAGDRVKKGEPVLEIETDKVNLDLEAEADGVIEEIAVEAGSMAEVGATLATIGSGAGAGRSKKAEKKEAPKKEAEAAKEPEAKKPAEEKPRESEKPAAAAPGGAVIQMPERREGRVKSSPLARRVARDLGVDLNVVNGSGPSGRIVVADVEKAAKSPVASPGRGPAAAPAPMPKLAPVQKLEAKSIPLSAMRRTIAKRLSESIGPVPHFYLTVDYDVTDLLALRKQLNEIANTKVSVNDFVIRAAALALRHHPLVNSSWGDDAIEQHGEISIGVAVATSEGLITPVIRNAEQKDVAAIAAEVKALADKAKNRKLKPDEYQGATFTISNLGMFGIEEFTAIINPPNVAILAVGAAEARPVVVDRQIVVRDRMKVTMSCDHRVVDGAVGADFLRTLRQYIEQPLRIVIG